jgi:AcrR family transcriptional regulator
MPSRDEGAGALGARPGISSNGVSADGRTHIEEIQRARLLSAMVEVASKHGLADASVARVVARAGVSRRTFYELFEDRESCFLAALDEGVAHISRHVLDAYDPRARWAERIRTALAALLSFLDVEPGVGHMLVVGSLGAGAEALERRRRVLAQMIAAVDDGRGEVKTGSGPPPLTAEGVVGGALSVIHARLLDASGERLVELTGPLMGMIVLPYLGPAAARRELMRPVPAPSRTVGRAAQDPLRELGMRLTYRTMRVLMSVAAKPGSSNRQIGVAAGIGDQGQISKLLGRLERVGLVSNTGIAAGKGGPNAWGLTERGERVQRAMSADSGRACVEASTSGGR